MAILSLEYSLLKLMVDGVLFGYCLNTMLIGQFVVKSVRFYNHFAFFLLSCGINKKNIILIDIVEFAANDRGWTQSNPISSKHNQNGAGQKLVGQIIDDAQYTFHTYAVDWTPTSLKFYFDGQLVKDPDHPHNSVYSRWGNEDGGWPYDKPFSIVLNLAIGGDMALQGGPLVEGDFWNPEMRKMYVDYVRVHDNGFNQIH